MIEFPILVYRCPGDHFGPPGTTYTAVGATTQKEVDKLLSEGWHLTLPAAAASFLSPADPPPVASEPAPSVPDDDAPPTREEMMVQAQMIGLMVDRRWSDATLLSKISAVLAA